MNSVMEWITTQLQIREKEREWETDKVLSRPANFYNPEKDQ